jgi:hypothetical protein
MMKELLLPLYHVMHKSFFKINRKLLVPSEGQDFNYIHSLHLRMQATCFYSSIKIHYLKPPPPPPKHKKWYLEKLILDFN